MKGGVAIQVVIEFDKDLLQHFDVAQFNSFVNALFEKNVLAACWSPTERAPALVVLLDFTRLQRAHCVLDNLNVSLAWLAGANFEGASLKGARLGCCPRANFRSARFDHATDFRHVEISGCDFTGAVGIESAMWAGAVFEPSNPPKGLPPEVIALCRPEADPPSDPGEASNQRNPSRLPHAPVRCRATIHVVPSGE